jgi:hypothetical protein
MNIENLKKAKAIIDKEFNDNMKNELGTFQFTSLCRCGGELKELIRILSDPNELIKANKIYKKTYE